MVKDPAASCEGKKPYYSWVKAERVRSRSRLNQSAKTSVYKCHFCGAYHIGTAIKRKRNRKREIQQKELCQLDAE